MDKFKTENVHERQLIEGVRAGENIAVSELVNLHGGWMLAVAQRLLRDRALAEDCVQESFIRATQNIDSFEGRSTLKSWLHRIVINSALMKLRSKNRRNESSLDEFLPVFDANDCRIERPWHDIETPEKILLRANMKNIITENINALPDDYRVVILLRDIEEMSTREVAEALECSEGAVKVRLHRARAALKSLLEPILRGEDENG